MDIRVVHHLAVPAGAGAPGAPSNPLGGNLAVLPEVLRTGLAITGAGRFVFACNPRLASGPQHLMTSVAGLVNCQRCRDTAAWRAAPDDGPYRKFPDAGPAGDGLGEFLDKPAPVAGYTTVAATLTAAPADLKV